MPTSKPAPRARLTQQERHAQILALLRRDGTVRIATLAKSFAVTTETARRDLDELAESGALQRTYGGGAMRSLIDEPGIGLRGLVHAPERNRIAAAAADLVQAGDALMIDSGSTTSMFAGALAARNLHLTVVTNCLPVANALGAAGHCRVILCPGDYVQREGGVFGTETVAFLRRFQANKAFIGAGGVTADGITDADSAGCAVKRAMIERADRALLLADSSKFDVVQFERIGPLADLDDLVTEAAPPRRLAAALRRDGVAQILAPR
ncbi:MAG: DeoR/GlpR transcriptional regulator [Betaproteobacteria bacterium]|nr:DeoR/GlpR transcriptional regulator [Betaproteobacteria bacterium]